jgi:hypothetical protein
MNHSRPDFASPSPFPCAGRHASPAVFTRREMLARAGLGLGGVALSCLLGTRSARAAHPPMPALNLLPKPPHFAPKAKNVIVLFMGGGPSQMDLFDPKPLLNRMEGQAMPFGVEQRGLNNAAKIMGSPFRFAKHGQSGHDISELLPHLATVADDLAFVRSGVSTRIDHGEAELLFHTGRPIRGFPTIGSWASYGLGTANANLTACSPSSPPAACRRSTKARR